MSSYVISCCSTADLTEEHFSKREISYICFHYKLNDTEYADDLGKSMPFDQFYAAMAAGASTKTSQVNADEFEAYFETFLQDGKDILHVCLSSGISGVLNSAMIAKADLEERYPERKTLIVDSLGASSGYGLLMDRLADLRDEGKPLEEVYDFAMKNRLKVHHWFFSTDLTFYVRGGRISKASGAIGGLLGICPLLNMDNEGRLIPRFKIRTKKKVIKKIVDQMEENAEGGLSYSGKCYISQSACYEDARAVADLIEERFPNLNGKVEINNIGTTIGSHTGPGTVALQLCQRNQTVQRNLTDAFFIPVVGVRVTENLPRRLCHRVTAFQTELFQPDQHFLPLRRFFYFSVHYFPSFSCSVSAAAFSASGTYPGLSSYPSRKLWRMPCCL